MHSCQIFMKKYLHEGKNTPKNEVNVTLNKKSISEHHNHDNHDRAALHGPQPAFGSTIASVVFHLFVSRPPKKQSWCPVCPPKLRQQSLFPTVPLAGFSLC